MLGRRIIQIGNSAGVTIPAYLLREMGWPVGTPVVLYRPTENTLALREITPQERRDLPPARTQGGPIAAGS